MKILPFILLLVCGCDHTIYKSGKANLNPSYSKAQIDTIGVVYLSHSQVNIGNMATFSVEEVLKSCNKKIILAAQSEEYLHSAGLYTFPIRTTHAFMDTLNKIMPYRYLLKGTVNRWENPFTPTQADGPKVDITLELLDLKNKSVVWTFSGGEESTVFGGDSTWFAKARTTRAQCGKLVERAFKTFPGFCNVKKVN